MATLERYVQVQSQENAYDLEANIAVLKLYQFNQQYNTDITTQILLKALTNLPHTDFALCKCLLNEQMVKLPLLYIPFILPCYVKLCADNGKHIRLNIKRVFYKFT